MPAGFVWPAVPHFLLHFHDPGLIGAHEVENPEPFTIHRRGLPWLCGGWEERFSEFPRRGSCQSGRGAEGMG